MNVLATILLSIAAGALPATVVGGLFAFRVNRATATKVLAEAEDISRDTAIKEAKAAVEFAHHSYESVKQQCDSCHERLKVTEDRLQRSEQRMHLSEERLLHSEEREHKMQIALRAIVRVMDENDPTQVEAAIAAARELL